MISSERQKQAEEENDRVRAEKQANRADNLQRINQQRDQRITQQNEELARNEMLSSFQNDPTPLSLTTKPKTKEERKEGKFHLFLI
jgi:hypothetical protein